MEEKDIVTCYERYIQHTHNFGFPLRDQQTEVITALINGRNTFTVLPMGYGKAMCYSLPPLILDNMNWSRKHVALVFSPSKARMQDQVKILKKHNMAAATIASDISEEIANGIKELKYTIIFASPESLLNTTWVDLFLTKLYRDSVCLVAFDEVHCMSEWSDDFRPNCREVNIVRSIFTDAPALALTATCTELIRNDIFNTLALNESDTLTISLLPNRPNIQLVIKKCSGDFEVELEWLLQYLVEKKYSSKKAIVYCRNISVASDLYCHLSEELVDRGLKQNIVTERLIELYHSSTDEKSKARIQDEFIKEDTKLRCLISTSEFGMDVQIPDVELIVHWGAPKTSLSYWQEVGRTGRVGQRSFAVCLPYGQSLDKRKTSKDMKDIVGSDECIRYSVLKEVSISSSDSSCEELLKKRQCDGKCEGFFCDCANCTCCSRCFLKCLCPKRADVFGIDVEMFKFFSLL